MIKATHPASNPPPNNVVPKYTNTFVPPAGCVPSHKSRNPPWTINTERVSSAPTTNHQRKDRSAMVRSSLTYRGFRRSLYRRVLRLSRTLQVLAIPPFRIGLCILALLPFTVPTVSILYEGKSKYWHCHCRRPQIPAPRFPLWSCETRPGQMGLCSFCNVWGGNRMCRLPCQR